MLAFFKKRSSPREHQSPHYTTPWEDILGVKVG
ncbi:MAG: DUF4113 domain-containing protein [Bacteroidales bacterium]|nr:DUF4113 domain-containing protein [Bacteroidales bacterium]